MSTSVSGARLRPHSYQGYGVPGPYDQPGSLSGPGPVTAEQILAERFARGEIDEDEFWQRMTTLRAGAAGRPLRRALLRPSLRERQASMLTPAERRPTGGRPRRA
jgi:hypothetical protein